MPQLQISTLFVYMRLRKISGAINNGVPHYICKLFPY